MSKPYSIYSIYIYLYIQIVLVLVLLCSTLSRLSGEEKDISCALFFFLFLFFCHCAECVLHHPPAKSSWVGLCCLWNCDPRSWSRQKKTSRATGLAPRRAEPWATATYNHQGAAVVRNSGDIWSWLWILAVFYKLRHRLKSVKWTQTLMAATLRLSALDSVSMKNQSRKQPSHCWCVPATLRVFVRRKGRDVCVILYSALSPEQLYSPVSFNSSNSIIGPT